MKIKEIREKNQKEIEKDLIELRNKFTKMKFDISGKQMKNHREIRKIKKDIAKILTVLNSQKEQ
ncbi:MAG: 50S ribosomal protein L29 [Candidatus Moranbacteria bacterium RIFOXYB1_FULL_43_19]|nr:MAG: 50S ribosomal protein L29 [Candidatus Moranbacteria bacterium RIFOXYB1_FULL_43_19]OGI28131.1 MAG: 50S ribosomal protein L29 [Candidatus Moranbacteria bacterium RIFOXYA1_FULL_44_7]OGI34154.1 MAG: 50S ribosomal protein L29 [Candidatus Moranbacteria bacterium RIFOXYC1_FULL_44_13]OGI38341.1 MAG: 50S ribosomal protein L29 [Candidatus Moranbacteria bacterium RIFOXYD1_FULL_44_12]